MLLDKSEQVRSDSPPLLLLHRHRQTAWSCTSCRSPACPARPSSRTRSRTSSSCSSSAAVASAPSSCASTCLRIPLVMFACGYDTQGKFPLTMDGTALTRHRVSLGISGHVQICGHACECSRGSQGTMLYPPGLHRPSHAGNVMLPKPLAGRPVLPDGQPGCVLQQRCRVQPRQACGRARVALKLS